MLLEADKAQQLFNSLPGRLQPPTLSPAYVVADSLRDPHLRPVFLAWQRDSGFLMHALHESEVPGTPHVDWQSAYGYGGPIVYGLSDDEVSDAWKAIDAIASERSVVAEFVRFHPILGNQQAYPGARRVDRQVVYLDLESPDLLNSYSGRARTAIRKALAAGLQPQWESPRDARASFPDFYREGMRRIGASDFYHFSDRYFDALLALANTRVLSILQGTERLAMGVFLFGSDLAEYHLSATSEAGRVTGATNLLLHAAALRARDNGCRGLFLGGGTDARPDNPLLKFKSSFAPASLTFYIGHRVHGHSVYAAMQAAQPELARSGRVLFYRR